MSESGGVAVIGEMDHREPARMVEGERALPSKYVPGAGDAVEVAISWHGTRSRSRVGAGLARTTR
jgi:hypothetical protein